MALIFDKNNKTDFYDSMQKPGIPGFNVENARSNDDWKKLEYLYNKNYLHNNEPKKYTIPRTIHQIWLGSALPERYSDWQKTWITLHPEWNYKLWTDSDLDLFKMINSEKYYSIKSLGARSDILRYEILYKYGGIYADTDFECMKSFDDIITRCSFFAGIPHCRDGRPLINNALIGSSPGNKIIFDCITNMKMHRIDVTNPDSIMEITGASLLSDSVINIIDSGENDIIIFPASFFYPFRGDLRNIRTIRQARKCQQPETFALHYWEVSWWPDSRSLKQTIKNLLPKRLKRLIKKYILVGR
jgi:inositol phosphorylceramide mannosyltransferase catalytic subunit